MRAYLDSCIVIYLVEENEPWHGPVTQAIQAATDFDLLASDLVRMECLVRPWRDGNAKLADDFTEFLGRYDCAGLNAATFDMAARLRAVSRLRTPDALHLACAIEQHCDEFWTNDHRLDRVDIRLRVRVFGQ